MSHDRTGGAGKLAGQLSSAKRQALLQKILRERGTAVQETIPRRTSDGPAPLSFAQQRLWLVDRLDPGSAAYNVPFALRLRGALDTGALRAAVDALVRRHETLRTTFAERDGEPVQVVHPPAPVPLAELELRQLPEAEREPRAGRLAAEESLRPFDLEAGPLLRSTLLRLGDEDHVLLFTLHHIVSDGWSRGVLVREVSALYGAFSRGEEPGLPELPVQYADYAVWQRGWLSGRTLQDHIGFWKERLAGAPPLLEIPTDRPRVVGQGPLAGKHHFLVPAGVAHELRELSQREGATLFMTLLAGWQVLLARYSGQDDVVVGTPIAGRSRREVEGLIGFFVNTLALRADLGGDPTLAGLVRATRETALRAFDHQELPFERLVEELSVERSLTHAPVFQVAFAVNQAGEDGERLELGELVLEPFGGGERAAKFDLDLSFADGGGALGGALNYRLALFEAATIERMAGHLETVLEAMAADPRRRLSELSLLRASERAELLAASRTEPLDHPAACLHELFSAQAARTPDAPAVSWGGEALSYAELERRSNRLAHDLRGRGVRPETRVGVCLERGPEMVVATLGVLKAGGAYVPLDPAYPAERLAYTLADSGAALLVSQGALADALPDFAGEVVRLDADRGAVAAGPDEPPVSGADVRNAAYVIYTSGSTGRPKGVVVEHASLVGTLLATRDTFGFAAGDVFPGMASYAFDIWAFEAFAPLLAGGQVRLLPQETVRDVERLVGELAATDAVHAVPALMREIVARVRAGPGTLPRMRAVFIGGDAIAPDLLERTRTAFPAAQVWAMYGPTENTMISSATPLRRGTTYGWQMVGRPLPGVGMHVLDGAGNLLPVGVPGELCLAGAGTARGYLGQAALTAAQFVPDALGSEPGARLYRTGDRVRRRADGELEFLGRVDAQVKIRGFRVEPGEVEGALALHPGVREAVVTVRRDASGAAMLVAYVVPAADAGAALVDGARRHLRDRLPEHMVPGAFVVLDSLPLTPNGKIDLRALPAPERSGGGRASGAPLTETERAVAAIWEETLGVAHVGVGDNFFDLGGHSLLLVRVHSRLQERFPDRVALIDLFEHQTLGALAAQLDRHPGAAAAARLPARAGGRRKRPAPRPFAPSGAGEAQAAVAAGAHTGREIAIIGMAGRFPGASDVDELWRNLRSGVRSIRRFSDEELRAAGVSPREFRSPGYVPAYGQAEGVELFDAAFFGITPREAVVMNPQQRVFLECAWEALERAGCASRPYPGRIGVFASEGQNHYVLDVLARKELVKAVGAFQVMVSNSAPVATLASYKLGLEGPSMNVQTACSSSLVAVHQACWSLLNGESDVALAGGVRITVPQNRGYHAPPGGIASPTGECSPFDAEARGSVGGSGAGVVVLKRLADALEDGDTVLAVIRGSAVNNDGERKVSFTSPRREAQAAVIADALEAAGLEPGDISYVEAHGSGTEVGDPIEVAALVAAFGEGPAGSCALGAVKSSIGHLDTAAGVVGLIKAALALHNGEIPPSPYFRRANPRIDFARSPFYVNPELRPWPRNGTPRRAGVSSFGMGGTNAHVVLEEAPRQEPSGASRPWQLLVLSARTPAALEASTDRLGAHLREHPALPLGDVAHTLRVGRRRFEQRRVLVCRDAADAAAALEARDPRRLLEAAQERDERPVAFLFPGVGDHYPQMARGLYEAEPVFRREVDRCAEILRAHTAADVRDTLFPGDPAPEQAAGGGAGAAAASIDLRGMLGRGTAAGEDPLRRTERAHPAVFVVEYALARLWMSWGVRPESMIGHSLGEYVAATVAGVFSLDDALGLMAERARLISELAPGAMLAVPLEPAALAPRLGGGLALAAHNAPGLCTVSGPAAEVAALEAGLGAEGIACRALNAEHAFHSPAMEPVAERLAGRLRAMRLAAPEVPFLSNVTGTWIRAAEATDPEYWARHLCGTVRFAEGMAELLEDGSRVLLEVGPGRTLGTFALHAGAGEAAVFASLRHAYTRQPDQAYLLETLGRLWMAGVQVDWDGFVEGERRRRTLLPTYPFERRAYWVERVRRRRRRPRPSGGGAADPGAELEAAEPRGAAEPAARAAAGLPGLQPRPETGTRYTAPEGEVEERMAALWQALLGFERIGVHDDFFSLGGHSLAAMQLITRVQDVFRVDVALDAVFDTPTVAGMAQRVAALLADARAEAPSEIRPVPRTGPLPLSYAQERIWVVDRIAPGSPMYNVPVARMQQGPLDVAAAQRALAEIVRRHEVFRTVYRETDAGPVQVILPHVEVPLPVDDCSHVPEAERPETVRRMLDEEARRPLDLVEGPVLRARLLRFGAETHALLLTRHHIIMDGWSGGVFFYELRMLYEAFVAGKPSPLPELPIQYADYAVWQREQLSGERLEQHLAFWRESLRGVPPTLELPTDRPHPPVQSYRGGLRGSELGAELAGRLRSLAQRERTTLHMILVAAFQALCFRYTGQEDFAMGSLVANRDRPETQLLIGFFINTLPVRARPTARLRFGELVEQVRAWTAAAYAHAELPLQVITDEVRPERDPSRNALIQVMLGIQSPANHGPPPEDSSGLAMYSLSDSAVPTGDSGTSKFDLSVLVAEVTAATSVVAEYNSDLFDVATVDRFLEHFRVLLDAVAEAPETPLAGIPLLPPRERRQLLESWNATAAAHPHEGCIHELFAAQAARTPEAVAVVCGGRALTYAELERRSDALARRLAALGVRPEARVGVCLERGPETVVALLGVLGAGGAYLPLDPAYPAERLAYLLGDAGASVLLTQQRLLARLPEFGGEVVTVDGENDGVEEGDALSHSPSPDGLAYVIYTSGSTGRPKGVLGTHRATVNRFAWMWSEYPFAAGEVCIHKTSLAFVDSVWEVFGPLLAGVPAVLVPDEDARDAEALVGHLARHGVTRIVLVPSLLDALLDAHPELGERCPRLRLVVSSGEALPSGLARRFARAVPEATLLNLYGSSEVAADVTHHPLRAAAPAPGERVPIGRPIWNTRTYVLDGEMGAVPTGAAGELYVAGDGLARGYAGRPAETAERFVPDPFACAPGGRAYRTGDRARWTAGGELEYLGRADQQVKVRGFRIEPGEIEAVLREQAGVRDAVAAVREDARGQARIVAYVVAEEGDTVSPAELRDRLGARLPGYMVPSAFVALDRLPLNNSGKVDRRALPAPEWGAEGAYAAPGTAMEEVLAGIWAELLGLERVGVHDDFFRLGGHSLLATQVVSRVRQALAVEVPLRVLFEARTVGALAERIALLRGASAAAAPPIGRIPRDGTAGLPLSFSQQRLWVVDRLQPGSAAYNMPASLRLRGRLDAAALRAALAGLARRHESLRTTFAERDGVPVQVIHPAAPVPLPVVDVRGLPEAEREPAARRLAREEALRPFDLARGPLLRCTLLRLGEADHVLCFNLHHIVTDGWSRGVLVREVSALYAASGRGEEPRLPELPVQYADHAVWQRRWISGEVLEAQIGFWKEALRGAPPLLEIPTDHARAPRQSPRAESHRMVLPRGLLHPVRELSRREGATLFMTLLAGWQALLSRYAGQEDVVVGSPISGRNRHEIEGLIGFFVNMLSLRVELGGDPTWTGLLARVREATLGAYDHQELPFERLVDELALERSPTHEPVFQTIFTLVQAAGDDERLLLGEVELERFDTGGGQIAKYDLDLVFTDAGDSLLGVLTYRVALFEADTIARMAGHLETMLGAMAADPHRRLSEVSLLGGAERAQVLHAWNDTTAELPRACIHELFSRQAERTPGAVAVLAADEEVTYAELERRSNSLAHLLRARGVGPESRVGLLVDRGIEVPVALLGILKAGGAYVPLEPGNPAERLREVFTDAGVSLVLTRGDSGAHLPAGLDPLRLDDPRTLAELSALPESAPALAADPAQLAYVIYTSGSTGRPKGVAVAHHSVVRLVRNTTYVPFGPEERIAQVSNLAFDAATFEFWGALLNGGSLAVVEPDVLLSPERFGAELRERGVTAMFLTAALFNRIAHEAPDAFATCRHVLVGGEALDAASIRRVLEAGGPQRLLNGYGPTETTTFAVWHHIREVEPGAQSIPIGRALANTTLYVLGAGGEPVPPGLPGELYVGGPGVARGYLGHPEPTAERFVPDPFSAVAGGRLYRTGDRVRRLPTGEIEYLGRLDAQVKIRGFRIEPGEVEAVLGEDPQVREAAVVVREDVPGQKRLAAYVVPVAGAELATAELRSRLGRRLPEYMVPSAFVVLEKLPLNANGKVDRRALPAPEREAAENALVAPRTEVEAILCEVWAEVLRVERVGVEENFFELGGDSILSIQVVSRARKRGLKLTPKQFFEHLTVSRLAEVAEWESADTSGAEQGLVEGDAPLTPIQRRFFETEQPARHHYNMGLLLQPREALDARLLARAAAAVEAHHDALRLRFHQAADGGWTASHGEPSARGPLVVFDLSALPAAARKEALETAAEQVQRSMHLSRGPLLRMCWFEPGRAEPGRLLATAHHLVVDAVSWRVLVEDLESAYTQLSRGEIVALPAKTTSWKAWAERLAVHARSAALAEEAAYWSEQAAREVAPLPVDNPEGASTLSQMRGVSVRLTEEETDALLREVPAAYRTQVYEVLLAALAGALGRWTGQQRVRVDLEGHGREEEVVPGAELSRTVGWFTSVYPTVLELPESGGRGAALKMVKEQLRAVPNRGIGYGLLRWLGRSETAAELARAAGAEVSFNYLGQFDQAVSRDTFFRFTPESAGASMDGRTPTPYRLEVSGSVQGGRLEMRIAYSAGTHRRETMERLAGWYGEELRALIEHCRSAEAGGYTPSDFPLAGLDQATLDALLGHERGVEDVFPLSPLQQGMLFHALYAPGSGVYVTQLGFVLDGPLDVGALERAWRSVVSRHDALRASFAWEGLPRPVQVVRRDVDLPFRVEDWRGLGEADQQARLEAYLAADRAEGFELGRAPLMRLALFRLGDAEHHLVWTDHHLIVDGWSLSLIFRDVLAAYAAFARGESPRLAQGRRYREYVAWLERQELAGAERFWRRALAGFAAPTPLPGERRAGGAEQGHGVAHVQLGEEDTRALQSRARGWGVTLSTLVQGAWALLLGRHGGEDDVVFGATVAGRPAELAGAEETVGLFINTLPVRVRLDGAAGVREWLQGLQKEQVEAREHEYAPLADVQRWSEVPAGQPLFESLVVFENYPVDEAVGEAGATGLGGLRVRPSGGREQASYPLGLQAQATARLRMEIRYDRGRVEAEAVERVASQLEGVLEAMAAPGERRLSELPLLRGPERARVLEAWNATASEPPRACLHELFAEQAARTPEAVAVVFRDESLTYEALERRSGRLAHLLRGRGVGPETCVGLCVERGLAMVVGLLGILRAGGVYVPLDPAYPAERLAYMLADSGASVLLTEPALRDVLPSFAGTRVCLDLRAEPGSPPGAAPVESGVGPDNAAYVIYTSGSTGLPKGVVVTHGNAANLLPRAVEAFGAGPGSRVLQTASPSFDASLLEIFVALLSGGALHAAEREVVLSAERLGALLREREIEVWVSMPALLEILGETELPALHTVSTGGERCPAETAARWSVGRRLVNMYGPTETTIYTTAHACAPGVAQAPPIGRPVANARAYVVDGWGEPAPVGVPGELWIGGAGVSRGYLGRPELTAERFVPDAFGGAPGGRLYRTGDRARWLAGGELEYLGRTDTQVKIRGFRIEPGEIEAALLGVEGVREALVLAREDVPGQKRLVGYVAARAEVELSTADLRAHLAGRLPEHMVPGAFVVLERLPLTAGGKVDRRALPAPERGGAAGGRVAPRTEAERILCEVWAGVLKLDHVGVEASFFELGGDSILSIQVVSRARAQGLKLTPRQIFEHPTVAALAGVAERVDAEADGAAQGPVTGEAPLTPVQRRFFETEQPARHHYNMGLLLRPAEALDAGLLARAAAAVEAHHDALRLRFRREADGGWTASHAEPGARGPLGVIDLSGLPAGARKGALEAAAEQVQRSMNLSRGPLLRMAWFRLGGAEAGRLLATAHHLVVDAVSWRVLLEDLEAAYTQLARGESVALPPKTTSWRAWAERLAGHARSAELAAEAAYWREQAALETAPLPTDDPRGESTPSRMRGVSVRLTEEETEALLREVPAAYRTQVDEVLLAALAGALGRWTGRRRVRVDLEGHGREEEVVPGVDLSRTVGWFTTVYPTVLELPESGGPGAALKAVKEQLRAVPRRGIGYGLLRYLGPAATVAELGAAAGAEVSFNYLGQLDQAVSTDTFFRFAPESAGAPLDGRTPTPYRLEVSGSVQAGRLEMRIVYSAAVHRRGTMEHLAQWYGEELRALIEHCRGAEAGGYTPSDFPLAGLDEGALEALLGSERGVEDVFPLSPLQAGMLFHALYAPGSGVYVGQLGFVLEGPLDAGALERAWRSVVSRHDALRASFAWEGLQRPVQVVRRDVDLPFRVEDWRGLGDADRQARLEAYLETDRAEGFYPGRAPLMRLALFRLGDAEHHLVWTDHHLIVDGWSLSLIFRDVLAAYAAFARGESPRLAQGRRYREYVAWLERQELAGAERFWRRALAGFAAPTPLPGERRAAAAARGHGVAHLLLGEEDTRALQSRARGWGVTLSTLVQGAWALLLGRHAGEDDVVFGAIVAGRPAELAGVEETVGMFINTLPVRVRLDGAAGVREWLVEVQKEQAEAREHEYAPLVDVQRWSGVPPGEALFRSVVVFENYPIDEAVGEASANGLGGLRVRPSGGREQANYPLVLSAHATARLRAEIRYDAVQIDPQVPERLMRQLAAGLEAMAEHGGRRLSELSLLREGERAQLLATSRGEPAARPSACLHELFAARAERTPDAPAVSWGGATLGYAELDRAANRLAHHLRRRGVGPETRVGICLERGPEMVVGVLGVLKAGGAYVPLDPDYPAGRLAYTLSDSGASLLLTRAPLLALLSAFQGKVVCLDADAEEIAAEPEDAPASGVGVQNAAYVIYTSGSTGRPKGVVVEHASLVSTLLATRDTFAFAEGETMPGMASYAFDIWAFEVFTPLLAGGRVRLLAQETVRDVERLVEELTAADAVHAVPALMREVVARVQAGPGTLPRMRRVFVGGDAIAPDLLEQTRAAFPAAQVWAMYGPTENTIISSATPLRRGTSYGWQMVGRPLPGVGMHVVDPAGNLLPVGVPGELCLAGAGVARGYLGRADVTADRFVPDALSGEAGARLYRTGDRVRRRADGELEFLGRVDAQVKIRGFRIEPGEIEAVLLEQEGVHEAVVLVREDPAFGMPGQKRLAAYVVPVAGGELATAELRARLGRRLPEYMVPSAFVVLDKLPLNANGKVDPRALPAPEAAAGRGEYVAPATPTQRFVAEVWGEALGIERVGVDDSFFELGGHSLLLVRVHARLRERFPGRVALVDLFEHRTLGTLAEYLDGLSGRAAEATADVMEQSRERGAARRERVNRHRATRPGRG